MNKENERRTSNRHGTAGNQSTSRKTPPLRTPCPACLRTEKFRASRQSTRHMHVCRVRRAARLASARRLPSGARPRPVSRLGGRAIGHAYDARHTCRNSSRSGPAGTRSDAARDHPINFLAERKLLKGERVRRSRRRRKKSLSAGSGGHRHACRAHSKESRSCTRRIPSCVLLRQPCAAI